MINAKKQKLKVFLCHSSDDKPAVRELYKYLKNQGWIDPWLDEEKLLPGHDWDLEIEKAVEDTDAVLVFLSNNSVSKEGYIQRELRLVLRIADFKPEGAVFTIPLRLDDCSLPRRLSMWQYVDCFPENRRSWAYKRLLLSLKARAENLGILTVGIDEKKVEEKEKDKANYRFVTKVSEEEREDVTEKVIYGKETGRKRKSDDERRGIIKKINWQRVLEYKKKMKRNSVNYFL